MEQIKIVWSGHRRLQELMTKGAAAVNTACYMDREDEEEGSVNVVRSEMLVVNMLKAEEEEAPKCLTDKEKFLA
jgi:hypothetical protein